MKKTFSFFVVSNKKIEINAFFPLQDRLLFCRELLERKKKLQNSPFSFSPVLVVNDDNLVVYSSRN